MVGGFGKGRRAVDSRTEGASTGRCGDRQKSPKLYGGPGTGGQEFIGKEEQGFKGKEEQGFKGKEDRNFL